MSSEVRRYSCFTGGNMHEYKDGDYVKYEDYEALEKEVKYLKEQNKGFQNQYHKSGEIINGLKKERDEALKRIEDTKAKCEQGIETIFQTMEAFVNNGLNSPVKRDRMGMPYDNCIHWLSAPIDDLDKELE